MQENPYEPPQSKSPAAEDNWGRRFAWSIVIAAIACALLLTISYVRPYGLFSDAPPTPARRVVAGIALMLQLVFFGAVLLSLVAGITWITRKLRR